MQNEIAPTYLELEYWNTHTQTKRKNQEGEVTQNGTALLTVKINEPAWGKGFII